MGPHHIRIPPIAATIAAAALALGGCSQKAEQSSVQAPIEQPVQHEPAPDHAVVAATPPAPAPAENMAQVRDIEAPPAPPVSREAQMLDDAAASGMTARLPRGNDASSDAGDSAQNDAH